MAGGSATRTGRRLLVAVALALVLVAAAVALAVPRLSHVNAVAADHQRDAPAAVEVQIESVDAARGTASVHLLLEAGSAPMPAEGVTVLTDLDGAAPLTLRPNDLTAPIGDGVLGFDEGSVSAYPFDGYTGGFSLLAVKGEPATFEEVEPADVVPLSVSVLDPAVGFDVAVTVDDQGIGGIPVTELAVGADRSAPVVVWATTMMAIYWLLAAAVAAVVASVLLGYREWETRHLAWLAAMIFAFSSFRTAAPGSPPIGVFFDYASFFWAVLVVAVALAALVGAFLVGTHTGLEGHRVRPAPGGGDGSSPDPAG